MFEEITQYYEILKNNKIGECICDEKSLPCYSYTKEIDDYLHSFYNFVKNHEEYGFRDYIGYCETHNIDGNFIDYIERLTANDILIILCRIIRNDRFCDGALYRSFIGEAPSLQLLKRLKELDIK